MDVSGLKNFLITKDLCFDNTYLDKYLNLLLVNLNREAQARSTQCHHAIPVSYYKRRDNCATRYEAIKVAEADPLNITVNLLYSDHLLAHAYLALCAKDTWFKFANTSIFCRFEKNFKSDIKITETGLDESLLAILESSEFQTKYEESYEMRVLNATGPNNGFYGRHNSPEHIAKYKATRKLHKELGLHNPKPKSADARERIGASKRGKLYVSTADKTVSKLISPEELNNYLAEGWIRGFATNDKPRLGKKHSEETKQKMSLAHRGKCAVAVECIELNKVFSSVSEAANELSIRPNAISNCLIGKCKTSGGYHWRYAK